MLPGTLYYSAWNNNGTCRFVIYVLVLVSQSLRSPRKMAGLSKIHRTRLMVNPDGGAWWAAIYGVALGRTRLKRFSSSSSQRRQWHPTPVLLPGKSHGWRSLEGCSPWGRWGLDKTERLHFHFSLSWIGKGNGNPLQYSCLEKPRDGAAWWAAVYGVTQSRTRLKQLSSSSSNSL